MGLLQVNQINQTTINQMLSHERVLGLRKHIKF